MDRARFSVSGFWRLELLYKVSLRDGCFTGCRVKPGMTKEEHSGVPSVIPAKVYPGML